MGGIRHASQQKKADLGVQSRTTRQSAEVAVGHQVAIKGVASKCSDQAHSTSLGMFACLSPLQQTVPFGCGIWYFSVWG